RFTPANDVDPVNTPVNKGDNNRNEEEKPELVVEHGEEELPEMGKSKNDKILSERERERERERESGTWWEVATGVEVVRRYFDRWVKT
ncbi:hypothetical protein L195_g055959, partial [Trifolium pratense]